MSGVCKSPVCELPSWALGMCNAHYLRHWKHGDARLEEPVGPGPGALFHYFVDRFEWLLNNPTDDCELWPYGVGSSGYGQLLIPGGTRTDQDPWRVHALSCTIAHGERPPGMWALHSRYPGGHPRRCFNPDHLRWGDARENQADAIADRQENPG